MPLPPYVPAPASYPADPVMVQAPVLRADVDGCVALLLRPPYFAGHKFTAQFSIASGNIVLLAIDAEDADPYSGHANPDPHWFPPLAGWYIAESSAAIQSNTSAGVMVAGIEYVTNGAAAVDVGGARLPITVGTGNFPNQHPICARLVQAVLASPNRAGTDTIAGYARQSTGAAQTLLGYQQSPGVESCTLQARWAGIGAFGSLPAPSFTPAPKPPNPLTAAWLQANSHDAISFLVNPPIMEYQLNGTQALASAASLPDLSAARVNLDTVIVDNYSAYSTANNRWTAPVPGVYYLYGQVDGNTATNTQNLAAGLTIKSQLWNGGTEFTWWAGAINTTAAVDDNCVSVLRSAVRLNAGDTVSLGAYQRNSLANSMTLNGTAGNSRCRLIAAWRAL